MPATDSRDQLTSWKEIAAFLGVAVRTAQRWERERGLPVRRLEGDKGRIVADAAQLAEWKKEILANGGWWTNTQFLQRYAIVSTALAAALGAGLAIHLYLSGRRGPPASTRLELGTLVVSDARGREVWRHQFPDVLGQEAYNSAVAGRASWFGNIDGDSETELLFLYLPVTAEKTGTALYCFSPEGKVKWRFTPGKAVTDGSATYSQTYAITDFAVLPGRDGGPRRIVVTASNIPYHPSQVALLDGTGRLLGEYWHSGHLDALDVGDGDGDGKPEIFLAGVNNGKRAATLVVLDPERVTGSSTQEAGDASQIRGFPLGTEKRVVLFPRTCQAKMVRVEGASVQVRVQENGEDRPCAAFYTLDRNFRATRVVLSDGFLALHRQLEASGRLDHPFREKEAEQLAAGLR